ncbi:penicillin-binding protein 2 [Planctomycetota bacterium]|nr:penicillin-binding protein 2 [Planctomycetota bacterium]
MQDGLFDHLDDSSKEENDCRLDNSADEGELQEDKEEQNPNAALGEGGLFTMRGGAGKGMSHVGAPKMMKAGEKGDETQGANRVLLIGSIMAGCITILFLTMLGRVVQLQTQPEEQLQQRMNRYHSKVNLLGRRGMITDRQGRPLAVSRVKKKLFIDPKLIEDRGIFSDTIAHYFNYDPLWIEKKMSQSPKSRYIVIDKALTDERLEIYKKLKLPGLALDDTIIREYPQGSTAGQLIGFVGDEGVGLSGLELTYDKRLTAEKGQFVYSRDARGRALGVDQAKYQPNENGENIALSIDTFIQEMAEDVLDRLMKKYTPQYAMMIVMDPHTGEILAMATNPGFDPREFRTAKQELQKNRCVTDLFEPGSIMKPIIWSGITQLGKVKAGESFSSKQGRWTTPYGRLIRDATTHGKDKYTWPEVLIYSSNIGMSQASNRITNQQMYEILTTFGFGKSTNSKLPGEIPGLLYKPSGWNKNYSKHSLSFGQEIGVTALQMITAISAIANDGVKVTPTIELRDQYSGLYTEQRVLTTAVAQFTRETMHRQVQEGGGKRAISKKYDFFGKTGTAQLVNPGKGYFQDRYMSSFVAGAPVDEPKLVIGCFVKDPNKKVAHYGGTVSAPAVREVMEKALQYLGVPPKVTDEDYKAEEGWPADKN